MRSLLLLTLATLAALQLSAQNITTPPGGDNQKSIVTQYIGSLVHVTVEYNSPDVTSPSGNDRTGEIWGQLVPYGLTDLGFGLRTPAPWRAGANENTTVEFSHDVEINGKPLKAGKYGFHVIVEESKPWTFIFSESNGDWGSYFYRPEEDALRVEAKVEDNAHHEWLTYEFTDRQSAQATLALMWELKKASVTIEVPNMTTLYVDNMREELEGSAGFTWQSYNAAAAYCLQNDVNLEEALSWAETSISAPFIGTQNFTTMQTKAALLIKLGRDEEGLTLMKEAVDHPTAGIFQIHQLGRQLIAQGKTEEALKIFILNAEKNPDTWPVDVGLARGYSAKGDYKKALKHAEIAYERAPDPNNKSNLEQAIAKLKKGEDIN